MCLSKEERAGVNRGRARLRRLIEENELPNPFTKKQLYERDQRFVHGKQYGETLPVMIKNSELFPLADGRLELNKSDGSELNLPAKKGWVAEMIERETTGPPAPDPSLTHDAGATEKKMFDPLVATEDMAPSVATVRSGTFLHHVERLREKTNGKNFLGRNIQGILGLGHVNSVYPFLRQAKEDGYVKPTGKKGEYQWVKRPQEIITVAESIEITDPGPVTEVADSIPSPPPASLAVVIETPIAATLS